MECRTYDMPPLRRHTSSTWRHSHMTINNMILNFFIWLRSKVFYRDWTEDLQIRTQKAALAGVYLVARSGYLLSSSTHRRASSYPSCPGSIPLPFPPSLSLSVSPFYLRPLCLSKAMVTFYIMLIYQLLNLYRRRTWTICKTHLMYPSLRVFFSS